MSNLECSFCGDPITRRAFCNEKCRKMLEKIARDGGKPVDPIKRCRTCGIDITEIDEKRWYCSLSCYRISLVKRKPYLEGRVWK